MRYLRFAPLLIMVTLLLACGNDHPNVSKLMSVAVSPSTATVSMRGSMLSMGSSMGTMTFTAIGKFDNNSSRMLSRTDGLTWMSTNTMIATIDMNGVATCVSAGVVRITASVPVSMTMIMNKNSQSATAMVSGTATLTCM